MNRSVIPNSLKTHVNLDNVNFVTNVDLKNVLARTTATLQQSTRRSPSNQEARLGR